MKSLIRKVPPLFYALRWCYRQRYPFTFAGMLLADQSVIKRDAKWYDAVKQTQVNKRIPLFRDRQNEVRGFFSATNVDLLKYYARKGCPNSHRFRQHMIRFFDGKTVNDELLKRGYEEAAFHYALRLMLAYERYSLIIPYLDFMVKERKKPLKDFKILDYGCGVSDIGLLFASLGAGVTIADLDDRKLDFTVWRFKKRSLEPKVIRVKKNSEYPELPKNEYDLVIATELFEHVRDPFRLLKNFTAALKPGGFLFDSMGGHFERDVVGDHLAESIEIGNSEEYKQYYADHYTQVFPRKDLTFLFRKN